MPVIIYLNPETGAVSQVPSWDREMRDRLARIGYRVYHPPKSELEEDPERYGKQLGFNFSRFGGVGNRR